MDVRVCPSAGAAAADAAGRIARRLRANPRLVLGLASGDTFVPVYARLAERHGAGELSFARASAFDLDEYLGLPVSDPRSCAHFIRANLLARVDIDAANVALLDGAARDPGAEAARFERLIAAKGGIDVLLLGIGRNGHIAFNEPGSAFASRTHVVRLAAETRAANARHFGTAADVPAEAITMGTGTILEAREIVLLATGAAKAAAVRRALSGPVSPDCPASALRGHANAAFVLDRSAADATAG